VLCLNCALDEAAAAYAIFDFYRKGAFVNAADYIKCSMTADSVDQTPCHNHWLIRAVEEDVCSNSSCSTKGEQVP